MLIFYIKEVLNAIFRAKLSFILALITSCIAIFLITVSFLLLTTSSNIEEKIKDRVSINLFLNDSLAEDHVYLLLENLRNEKFIKSLKYTSKDDAQRDFLKETNEDFREILDYNPLPASIEIKLVPNYLDADSLRILDPKLKKFSGVEDVVFQKDVVYRILEIISSVKAYVFASALVLVLISFYIVFSTNKLIINSKMVQIETMKLVGAKLSSIKIPVIMNGLLIGLLASGIDLGIFIFLLQMPGLKNTYLTFPFFQNLLIYLIISLLGPVLGIFASYLASRNITLKIKKIVLE
jgi:cell division transport system permease protein